MSVNISKDEKRHRKYLIELTLKTIIFWFLGSSFLFVWVFLLGVMVGRGYLSFDIMKDKFAVIQTMVVGSGPSKPEEMPGPVKDPKLRFYDELSQTKDEAAKNGGQGLEANTASENKPLADVHQLPSVKPDSAVEPVTQGQSGGQPVLVTSVNQVSQKEPETPPVSEEKPAPVSKPAPESKVATISPLAPLRQSASANKQVKPVLKEKQEEALVKDKGDKEKVRRYALNIGGFGDRSKAISMVKQLSSRGFNASLSNIRRGGRSYYKVSCGPFETEEMADDFKKSLASKVGIYGVVTKADN